MFKFHEGQTVVMKEDRPALGLKAGTSGVIWALYAVEPPTYEVTFLGAQGEPFDVAMAEEELQAAAVSTSKVTRKPRKRQVEAA